MTKFYGYIRVSTARQGEQGVSLEQQRAAIEQYAQKNSLEISRWFEERQTAAKRGRPVFNQMLKSLRAGHAGGVVIHKIDRSTRNLRDWADLGELIDAGVAVHFANESLDLNSRGGRLSADIQAVVAADFIRNLREETRKGFYGRLKQGLYPRPAPLGYHNQGGNLPKAPDSLTAPLIRQAFELYSTGDYTAERLTSEMYERGLRTRTGKRVAMSSIMRILHNPFYTGLILIYKTGEQFAGVHEPIITMALFLQVQEVIAGRVNRRVKKFGFLFRQLFRCTSCRRCLVGEMQKQHVYYRCHAKGCPSRTIREEALDSEFLRHLKRLEFTMEEKILVREELLKFRQHWQSLRDSAITRLKLQLSQVEERLNRLTDGYLDSSIDREMYEQRKTTLYEDRRVIQDQLGKYAQNGDEATDSLSALLDLAGKAYLAYTYGTPEEKRALLKRLSSNFVFDGKTPTITLHPEFQMMANRFHDSGGDPTHPGVRDVRVWKTLLQKLASMVTLAPKHFATGEDCSAVA